MEALIRVRSNFFYNNFPRLTKSWLRHYAKASKAVDKKYSSTVLLPQTKFPNRLNGAKRVEMDDYLIEKCGFLELYNWQRENLPGPDFILHDGPPYANGSPHMGHAVNKILKDITIRSRVVNGQRVHYVPGWDCHGLPIELKVLTSLKEKNKNLTVLEFRELARKYSRKEMKKQRETFISWGVMADWQDSGCYFTNKTSYICNELKQFINLYEKNLIYRDFKPVYWSPSSRTALAESELEYNDQHESECATVRFLLKELPESLMSLQDRRVYALTWTTTPWTLIANQALSYSTDIIYSIAEDEKGDLYIVAEDLLNEVIQKIGQLRPLLSVTGNELANAKYSHPITGIILPFLPSRHVTNKLGTGLVHTAPAHGTEDFLVGLAHNIPVISLVDEDGRYTTEAGVNFAGLDVLEEGGRAVLKSIGNDILHTEKIVHSYPYDWRTKKPVITRASNQWFINTESLKQKAIASLKEVNYYPKSRASIAMNSLTQQIQKRPFWCISRQRTWGTPIPVLYHKDSGKIVTDREFVEKLCQLFEQHGSDCWWSMPVSDLVDEEYLEKRNLKADELEKGQDIMDVWFDSGVSWSAVLPEGKADLYLEGTDQYNGWFQASLLTSTALQGVSPFKSIFVHGFTVDKNGLKMSKSLGNVVSPEEITRGGKDPKLQPVYGVDCLRWWVANHSIQHSQIPIVDVVLNNSLETVQRIRNLLRFLLGALYPYGLPNDDIKADFMILDRYMLHRLYHYNKEIQKYYDTFEYQNVCKSIVNFVTNDISAIYCHSVKDRLYCDEATSPRRIGAVDVIGEILAVVTRSIAPIMPHLAEEIWLHHPENLTSVPLHHLGPHVLPDEWDAPEIEEIMNSAIIIRDCLNKSTVLKTLELDATVTVDAQMFSMLSNLQSEKCSSTSELCNFLQVSSVTLEQNPDCLSPQVDVKAIEHSLCKRCRKFPEPKTDELCVRCDSILNQQSL